jgi:hypothetical protein
VKTYFVLGTDGGGIFCVMTSMEVLSWSLVYEQFGFFFCQLFAVLHVYLMSPAVIQQNGCGFGGYSLINICASSCICDTPSVTVAVIVF